MTNYAKNDAIKIYQSLIHLVGPLFGSKGSRDCKGCQA